MTRVAKGGDCKSPGRETFVGSSPSGRTNYDFMQQLPLCRT